jgi:hypothetical protein
MDTKQSDNVKCLWIGLIYLHRPQFSPKSLTGLAVQFFETACDMSGHVVAVVKFKYRVDLRKVISSVKKYNKKHSGEPFELLPNDEGDIITVFRNSIVDYKGRFCLIKQEKAKAELGLETTYDSWKVPTFSTSKRAALEEIFSEETTDENNAMAHFRHISVLAAQLSENIDRFEENHENIHQFMKKRVLIDDTFSCIGIKYEGTSFSPKMLPKLDVCYYEAAQSALGIMVAVIKFNKRIKIEDVITSIRNHNEKQKKCQNRRVRLLLDDDGNAMTLFSGPTINYDGQYSIIAEEKSKHIRGLQSTYATWKRQSFVIPKQQSAKMIITSCNDTCENVRRLAAKLVSSQQNTP